MIRTVFFELRRLSIRHYPKLLLRLNSTFKEMGFKSVRVEKSYYDDIYFEKLTLMINPTIDSDINGEYHEMGLRSEYYYPLYLKFKDMKGYSRSWGIYTIKDDSRVPMIIKEGEREFEIGCYLPERNLVILYTPIFRTNLELIFDNEVLFYIIKNLKEFMKRTKIIKIDVKEKIRENMISKFCENAKYRINSLKVGMSDNRLAIRTHQEKLAETYSKININKFEIENLKKFLEDSIGSIGNQLKEIEKLGFVKSVNLGVNGISVGVGNIKIIYKKEEVNIGDFILHIKPKRIEIENTTPIEVEYDGTDKTLIHPHIDTDGTICFGERKESIYNYLGNCDLKKLVYFVYLFLKSYNEGDCFYKINYWINPNYDRNSEDNPDEDTQ